MEKINIIEKKFNKNDIDKEIYNIKEILKKYKTMKKSDIPKINDKPADEFLNNQINVLEKRKINLK